MTGTGGGDNEPLADPMNSGVVDGEIVAGPGLGQETDTEQKDDEGMEKEEEDGEEVETSPFFGGRVEESAGLNLLSQGDSLPLSFRTDNGTRESEFYLEDEEKENMNPYYDVVRRLSPTELIGRFMTTSSPKVRGE